MMRPWMRAGLLTRLALACSALACAGAALALALTDLAKLPALTAFGITAGVLLPGVVSRNRRNFRHPAAARHFPTLCPWQPAPIPEKVKVHRVPMAVSGAMCWPTG